MKLLFVSIYFVLIIVLSVTVQAVYALYFGNDLIVTKNVEIPTVFSTSSPKQIAATEKGDVYTVWTQNNSIYFSSGDYSQKIYQFKVPLSQVNKIAMTPKVIATEKGDVYVVWVEKNNATNDSNIVFRSSNDSGKTFSATKELDSSKSLSSFPQLAAIEKGDLYIVWVDKNNKSGYTDILFKSSNDSGKTFSATKKLTGSKTLSSLPQLAATEKGDVYVVWVDKNNKTRDTDIVFRSSNDSGIDFDNRIKLRRSDSLLSYSPQLTANEKGDVYVVWTDKNTTTEDSDITFRGSVNSGKDFQRALNLNKGDKLSNSTLPQVAITGDDSIYAIWLDKQIQLKQISVKDAIVGERISLSNRTATSLFPQITSTKNGNMFALWIDKNNASDTSLHLKRISENFFERN